MGKTFQSKKAGYTGGYSVGVYGMGAVGRETVKLLPTIPEIDRLYLFTSQEEKGLLRKLNYGGRYVDFVIRNPDQLQSELDNIDMMVVCFDASNYRELIKTNPNLKREDILKFNLNPARRFSEDSAGFNNPTIWCTNPVDHLSYLHCSISGNRPEYTQGLAQTTHLRWQNIIRELFIKDIGIDKDLIDRIRLVTLGPHIDNPVLLFQNYAGLGRENLTFLSDEELIALRNQVKSYTKSQFSMGKLFDEGTECLTANAIKDSIEALIYEDRTVCQSVLVEPELFGIKKGVLDSLFFGCPVTFDNGKAVPVQVRIKDELDMNRLAGFWYDLENDIMKLEDQGYVPLRLPRIHNIKEFQKTPSAAPKRLIDLDTRIFAASDGQIFEWDDVNNPNSRKQYSLGQWIGSLSSAKIDGRQRLFAGLEGEIRMLSAEDYTRQATFRLQDGECARRIAVMPHNGTYSLVAATSKDLLIFDVERPSASPLRLSLPHTIRNFELNPPFVFVASDKVYKYNLENLGEEPTVYDVNLSHDPFSDVRMQDFNVIASYKDQLIRWPYNEPSRSTRITSLGVNGINRFIVTPEFDGQLYIATTNPQIYTISLDHNTVTGKFSKGDENLNGTGQLEIAQGGCREYLLATDKSHQGYSKNTGISIWDLIRPEQPLGFLYTNQDHAIRDMVILKNE